MYIARTVCMSAENVHSGRRTRPAICQKYSHLPVRHEVKITNPSPDEKHKEQT